MKFKERTHDIVFAMVQILESGFVMKPIGRRNEPEIWRLAQKLETNTNTVNVFDNAGKLISILIKKEFLNA